MIGPTDLLHPSPAPHFKTNWTYGRKIFYGHTKQLCCL